MFYFPHWPDRRMTYSSVQGHLCQNNSNINNTGVCCQNLKIFCDTDLWSCFPALAQTQSPGLNSLTLRRAHSSHIQHTKYWVQINFTFCHHKIISYSEHPCICEWSCCCGSLVCTPCCLVYPVYFCTKATSGENVDRISKMFRGFIPRCLLQF